MSHDEERGSGRRIFGGSVIAVILLLSFFCGESTRRDRPPRDSAKAAGTTPDAPAPEAPAPADGAAPASATDAPADAGSSPDATPAEPAAPPPGAVSGTARFDGEPPKRNIVQMSADPKCEAMHGGKKVGSEDIVIAAEGGLANVFVYVKSGLEGKKFPIPSKPAELDQNGCVYEPHVLGIMVGQQLDIVSKDGTLHNVNCMSKVNPAFNFGMPGPGRRDRVFRKAESPVKFKCDVHPWMGAWLHVMPHPFFAVSDRFGAWTITGLPPGEYTLSAWHEKLGEQERKITVTDTGATGVDFTFTGK